MTDKEQANNLSRYLYECVSGEETFDQEYKEDMERLDEYIDEAGERLRKAIHELYNKRDTFSEAMSRSEFDALIIEKIKEQL